MSSFFIISLAALLLLSFSAGKARAKVIAGRSSTRMRSLPHYYGMYTLLWSLLPIVFLSIVWSIFEPNVLDTSIKRSLPANYLVEKNIEFVVAEVKASIESIETEKPIDPEILHAAKTLRETKSKSAWLFSILVLIFSASGFYRSFKIIGQDFSARAGVEKIFISSLFCCSSIAILTTIGIVASLIFESIRFFQRVPIMDFLFGLSWSPQIAIREDQVGSSGAFGSLPLLAGTSLIAAIAMCIATPVGLFSAIYLAEYASKSMRTIAKPLLEILAGIPTVVYGFFAALSVSPVLKALGVELGLDVSAESALAAGLVMGVMIIPFISSLSDDVINAVPQSLRDGSYALGATKSETIKKVVLPAALPGIMGAVLLAVSRTIGETMIVVMAAGLAANLTLNPLESVTTVTVQIVTILVGDQEFDSAKTLAAFALGLLLFCLTLVFNIVALQIVKQYREKYE